MKSVDFKYSQFQQYIENDPLHSRKFRQFINSYNIPFEDEKPTLNFQQIFSIGSIKEIIVKDQIESISVMSLQSPSSAPKVSRRIKTNEKILEMNDMIKQLSKKINRNETQKEGKEEDLQTPGKGKSKVVRSPFKKISSIRKKSEGLEIIQEDEENKENLINSIQKNKTEMNIGKVAKKTKSPPEKKFTRMRKKVATFKEKENEKGENQEENKEEINKSLNKKPSNYPRLNRALSRNALEKQKSVAENDTINNFSLNISSQMSGNIPFNMSVNVQTNPLFNLTTNINSSNYPKKSVEGIKKEKSPIYPEINNLIQDESKKSSFKDDEKIPGQDSTNNLFRQRKIVIEHSMLITESYIELTKELNKDHGNQTSIQEKCFTNCNIPLKTESEGTPIFPKKFNDL